MGDTDFPARVFLSGYLPKVPDTQKPTGYLQEYQAGEKTYAQAGAGIPSFQLGQTYGQQEGGPVYSSLTAQGIPVGQDPIFPMSQEEFKDLMYRKSDQSKPVTPLSPELKQMIQNFQSRYSHLFT